MAIDLFCYSSLAPADAQQIIDSIVSGNDEVFAGNFVIYRVDDLRNAVDYYDLVSLEIALEHGIKAACGFMIHLSNKDSAHMVPTVLKIVKSAFGKENIVITSDGGVMR
ncbi:hypothetical protein [Paracidovorax valerianellae]|uniref:hypothetical protein n=1 Tax=Paracidovorax valerianellae TaxID=187868 RepID=UPI001113993D|nr:hypothetical protein [Paracidovorax valerianellae]MDA8444592.1 hypothetical protein [Paracidovorax valerianellae]